MEKVIQIDGCCHKCIGYPGHGDGLQCQHPIFGKTLDKGYIISHENIREGSLPKKCPLRKENLTIVYKLSDKIIE